MLIYEHGTNARYVADRCRCDLCRAAHAAYAREYNRRKRAEREIVEVELLDGRGNIVRSKIWKVPRGVEYEIRVRRQTESRRAI
jgi:hypothetical protein